MKDCWGECCDQCDYIGHPYKPCRDCKFGGARVPNEEIIVSFPRIGQKALILEKWMGDNNWLVIPIEEFSTMEDLIHTDLHSGEYVLRGGLLHTLSTETLRSQCKFIKHALPQFVRDAQAIKRYSLTGEGLNDEQKTRIGKPITEEDHRVKKLRDDYKDWARIFMPDHESQL